MVGQTLDGLTRANSLTKRKLCIVPCHSCNINGTWRRKEGGGGGLKLSYGGGVDLSRHNA